MKTSRCNWDIQFVNDQLNIEDDLLILAGDNLFEFSVAEFVNFAKNYGSDGLAMYYEVKLEQLKRNGTAIDFIEKPENHTYHHCVPTYYVLKRSTLSLIQEYLNEGNNPDATGNFIPYLIQRNVVKAFVFEGTCYDIGTLDSYNKVQKILSNQD
ncbi:sugar phosphate nucleotidyltransferase [Aerococcus urinaeequi]